MAEEPIGASPLTTFLETTHKASSHSPEYQNLALQVQHNLQYQHRWTHLTLHTHSPLTSLPLPRPLLSGLPPKRLYVHPDEQIALLKAHKAAGGDGELNMSPEREWVLPTHLRESWSLKKMANVFDSVDAIPQGEGQDEAERDGGKWRKTKRVLLATLDDDSTITYYIVHDGLVKPRQN